MKRADLEMVISVSYGKAPNVEAIRSLILEPFPWVHAVELEAVVTFEEAEQ